MYHIVLALTLIEAVVAGSPQCLSEQTINYTERNVAFFVDSAGGHGVRAGRCAGLSGCG